MTATTMKIPALRNLWFGDGKTNATLAVNAPEAQVREAALADDGVVRALEGKTPKKVIVVPNRIVNVVA